MHSLVVRKWLGTLALAGLLVTNLSSTPVYAQSVAAATASTAAVTFNGMVFDANGGPLANAVVSLSGPKNYATHTDASGRFTITSVVQGIYTITAEHVGYQSQVVTGYAMISGETYNVQVALQAQTLNSLQTIASVRTSAGRRGSLNVSPVSSQIVTSGVFSDQGQHQILQVLDQLPGYVTAHESANANPASPGAASYPNIRGSLTYETASLVDGHAVARSQGGYRTQYLNPALFQDVEVIKGPGATVPNINYAIGGAVNFRTLEPTVKPVESVAVGMDSFGSRTIDLKATGTTMNGRLSYAFVYAGNGMNGPVRSYSTRIPISQFTKVNGQYVNSSTVGPPNPAPTGIQNPPKVYNVSLYACCASIDTYLNENAELAKLRYKLSNATTLTATYLATHGTTDENGNHLWLDNAVFNAKGNFSDIAAGAKLPIDDNYVPPKQVRHQDEPVYQLDLRTALGKDTVLARWFAAATNNIATNGISDPAGSYTSMMNLYGTFTPCSQYLPNSTTCAPGKLGSPVTYNGQLVPVTFGPNPGSFYQCVQPAGSKTHYNTKPDPNCTPSSANYAGISGTNSGNGSPTNAYFASNGRDALQGGSLQWFHPAGNNVYSVSVDSNKTFSSRYNYLGDPNGMATAPGTSYALLTFMGRAELQPTDRLAMTLSTYFNRYFFRTSSDNGVTFNNSITNHLDGRLGVTYRANYNTSWRFAMGSSIAPPYIDLLDAAVTPNGMGTNSYTFTNAGTGSYYTTSASNPNLLPETAFGYNVGGSFRLDAKTTLDVDGYMTNLFNQYVNSRSITGTYTGSSGTYPLYTTQWNNLSNARYEGVETAVHSDPGVGLGYVASLALIRAYPYNLSNSFYGNGYQTNLAVVPDVNYLVPGDGTSVNSDFNGIARNNIPYAQGYGELSYRTRTGNFYSIGNTYYGPHNSFNQPPFVVTNATASWAIGGNAKQNGSIQLSAYNLLNAYALPYVVQEGGLTETLINGKTGYTNGLYIGPARFQIQYKRSFGP